EVKKRTNLVPGTQEESRRKDGDHESCPDLKALNLGIRQLDLLEAFSKVRSERIDVPDAALRWLAQALPAACQHPETACARVTLDGRTFATRNFRKTRAR